MINECSRKPFYIISGLLFFTAIAVAQPFIVESMLNRLQNNYGDQAYQRGIALNNLLVRLHGKSIEEKLFEVNAHFNKYSYKDDYKQWGTRDYWETPEEFIGVNSGDCEDYVIAKYFALRHLGVKEKSLYLTYVKAIDIDVAHMVLSYYESPESIPLVLDNYNLKILPANQRKDLLPTYSFNAKSLFLTNPSAGLGQRLPTDKIKNSKWTQLLDSVEKGAQ